MISSLFAGCSPGGYLAVGAFNASTDCGFSFKGFGLCSDMSVFCIGTGSCISRLSSGSLQDLGASFSTGLDCRCGILGFCTGCCRILPKVRRSFRAKGVSYINLKYGVSVVGGGLLLGVRTRSVFDNAGDGGETRCGSCIFEGEVGGSGASFHIKLACGFNGRGTGGTSVGVDGCRAGHLPSVGGWRGRGCAGFLSQRRR